MMKNVYISCDFNERELELVKKLSQFLLAAGCDVQVAPEVGHNFYRGIEDRIEWCDVFVAIVGLSRSCSTWLAFELDYASTLGQRRMTRRPRLFAVQLEDWQMPPISRQIPVTWVLEESYSVILEDSSTGRPN